jgi:hypothetical protein
MAHHRIRLVSTAVLAVGLGACRRPDRGPDVQIVDEATRIRSGEPVPRGSPYFDGTRVTLVAARGETLGLQVLHRGGGVATLALAGAEVHGYAVEPVRVTRPSSDLYGTGTRGAGMYPDELVASAAPATDPAYFELVAGDVAGTFAGELAVAGRTIPVELVVTSVKLPSLAIGAWAEYAPEELGGRAAAPSAAERACIAMFRRRGVLLAPPIPIDALPERKALMAGSPVIPVDLPDPPGDAVRAWIAATRDTGQVPFAIPIDEPRAEARPRVRAFAQAVRDAGGGPATFRFAVTDEPRAEYDDLVDLYLHLVPRLSDTYTRWTYNGAPPRAGAMVVDAADPGLRTWGWIAWRYRIPIWYAWDALYWHDRHNHKPAPPRPLDARHDATSFDNGDDHGNLDGVLALPGDASEPCHATLRLEALRRGLEDRALLELAAACDPTATAKLAAELVPRALGDATGAPAWPADPAAWEAARRRLLELARCR